VPAYGARFAGVAFPGETLKAGIWKDDNRLLANVVAPSRDNAVVLSGVELVPAWWPNLACRPSGDGVELDPGMRRHSSRPARRRAASVAFNGAGFGYSISVCAPVAVSRAHRCERVTFGI
jgi:hypothetical protein